MTASTVEAPRSSTALPLRPYQEQTISAVHSALRGQQRGTGTGAVNRVAVLLPTGTGKTVIFTDPGFWRPALDLSGRGRALVLVHRDELAAQAVLKLAQANPGVSVGRVQAWHDEHDAQIVVASVQTVVNPVRQERIRDVGLIVADEAHHAVAPSWVTVLERAGAWRGTPTVGFTATMVRGKDKGNLGDVWQEIVLRRDIIDMIRAGYLVDVRGLRVQIAGLDLKGIRRSHGDLNETELAEHLHDAQAPEQVAQAYREHAADRQGVAFWPDVATAIEGARAMNEVGIPTEVVIGSTPIKDREDIYGRMECGDTQVISNCAVLTEGWDMPCVSAAVIARPTESPGLYVQMVGRILRPWNVRTRYGLKADALVLDVVGASERNRLATLADLSITTKQVKPGQLLSEAADEEEREETGGRLAPERIDPITGERVVREIDLFRGSHVVWLQTPRGTWFIPAGRWVIFLWPEATHGLFTVGFVPSHAPGVGAAKPAANGLILDYAMSYAERLAEHIDGQEKFSTVKRGSSWRSRGKATSQQLAKLASLSINASPEMSKAQASDLISMTLATRVLGG